MAGILRKVRFKYVSSATGKRAVTPWWWLLFRVGDRGLPTSQSWGKERSFGLETVRNENLQVGGGALDIT